MWLVRELARRPSPERHDFVELLADGEVLSNAVNHVDWAEPQVLLSRCTYCRGDDVADGWVELRRSGELVVLQPSFAGAARFFSPPIAFASKGIAAVPHSMLRAFVKRLPPLDALAPWTAGDAILALQLESTPLFGRSPDELHIPSEAIVACSKPSLEEGLAALRQCVASFRHSGASVLLEPLPEGEGPVWFYVEGLAPRDGLPIAEVGGVVVPHFEPGLVAMPR